MLNIILIPLFIIAFALLIYFAVRRRKKGKAEYREPDNPDENKGT
jgi:cbb3-type cytochrome oxidase subunit 3